MTVPLSRVRVEWAQLGPIFWGDADHFPLREKDGICGCSEVASFRGFMSRNFVDCHLGTRDTIYHVWIEYQSLIQIMHSILDLVVKYSFLLRRDGI